MKEIKPRTDLASWLLGCIAAAPTSIFTGSDYRQPVAARAPEHTPDCTCTHCDIDFFEDELCESCGFCFHCCTCRLAESAADPNGNDDDDGECPYYDDDRRAAYWYANRVRAARLDIAEVW